MKTTNIQELKAAAQRAIDDHCDDLMRIGRDLYAMPESGYREVKTSAYVQSVLERSGLNVRSGIALTGLKATARGRESCLNVGLSGELDALITPGHPKADPVTGAAHNCGHHAQLTAALGVAFGLVGSGLIKELDGDLTFLIVPAEEIIELDFRAGLIRQGKISFIGGKQEFIHLGEIDDVDCILCSHITTRPGNFFDFGKRYNGLVAKEARFIGKSAHSARSPEKGINALHAAVGAINNINALRETFRDDDHIRVHYIITKGGDSVNIIPDDVRLEMCVRGLTPEAIVAANRKVNAALQAGAVAIGAQVDILDYGGYFPLVQNEELSLLFAANAAELVGPENVLDTRQEIATSSTDAGDFSSLKPTIHPNFGGAAGAVHTTDFDIVDEYQAYVQASKALAMTVIDLLHDHANKGAAIQRAFRPVFADKEAYRRFFGDLLHP